MGPQPNKSHASLGKSMSSYLIRRTIKLIMILPSRHLISNKIIIPDLPYSSKVNDQTAWGKYHSLLIECIPSSRIKGQPYEERGSCEDVNLEPRDMIEVTCVYVRGRRRECWPARTNDGSSSTCLCKGWRRYTDQKLMFYVSLSYVIG